MNYIAEIVVPIIAGLFALLGAYVGSRHARNIEKEKWLREHQSEKFSNFLEQFSRARKKATDILYDESMDEQLKIIKIIEGYIPVEEYTRVVALYLPEDKRKRFRGLAKELIGLHEQTSLGDSRFLVMEERLEEIQEIFEEQLR